MGFYNRITRGVPGGNVESDITDFNRNKKLHRSRKHPKNSDDKGEKQSRKNITSPAWVYKIMRMLPKMTYLQPLLPNGSNFTTGFHYAILVKMIGGFTLMMYTHTEKNVRGKAQEITCTSMNTMNM